jgi:hypothetical protein
MPVLAFAAAAFALAAFTVPAGAEGGAFDADAFFGSSPVPETPVQATGDSAGGAPIAFAPATGNQGGLSLRGEASASAGVAFRAPFDADARTVQYFGSSAARLDAIGGDRNAAKFEASVSVETLYGAAADQAAALPAAGLLAARPSPDAPVLALGIEKLFVSVHTPLADIAAGRMIINYGRGSALSPVDLFATIGLSGTELKRGPNDAARARIPFGPFSGLELVSTLQPDPADGVAGARHYGYLFGVDYGLSAFRDGRGSGALVAGFDAKFDLGPGWSFEAVARLPWESSAPTIDGAGYSLMLGADYSIAGKLFLDAELEWNLGELSMISTTAGQGEPARLRGFGSVSLKIDELSTVDVRVLVDSGGAYQLGLAFARSVATGARALLFAQLTDSAPAPQLLAVGASLSVAF